MNRQIINGTKKLPERTPASRHAEQLQKNMPNRLASQASPYLQQHAENPVDWFPWGRDAFEKAVRENLPVFLSVGYSSCHWCHVMEREVFEHEQIARFLNTHFVCIKVDREERPDIDRHFQEIYQLMNRRTGGWPLSIFLTPSGKPCHAATYIPAESSTGMTGFMDLIHIIHNAWTGRPKTLETGGKQVIQYLEAIRQEEKQQTGQVSPDISEQFLDQTVPLFQPEYGGFSPAPKFPSTSITNLLMDISILHGSSRAADMALHTLRCMAEGGMHDLVDGGFCRYSVDEKWLVSHFEKMTYDNALLCESYLKAWKLAGDRFFLDIAGNTAAFMQEKMRKDGLFYCASDADSEGEEGKYFLYTRAEAVAALTTEGGFSRNRAAEIADMLNISGNGDFEGKSIVRLRTKGKPSWYDSAISTLKRVRASRTYPFIDSKVLTAWNAMMIKSLFLMSEADPAFLKQALLSMDALTAKMYRDRVLYHSALVDGPPAIEAFLEDYAFLADAALSAFSATFDTAWLDLAAALADQAVERFYEDGTWYFSRGPLPTTAEPSDAAYPSSSATMVSALISLAALTGNQAYSDVAGKSISRIAVNLSHYPVSHSVFVRNAMRLQSGDIVIHARPEALRKIRAMKPETVYPLILFSPEDSDGFTLCRGTSCFAHAESADELLMHLQDAGLPVQ